jgi:hypothetical protein
MKLRRTARRGSCAADAGSGAAGGYEDETRVVVSASRLYVVFVSTYWGRAGNEDSVEVSYSRAQEWFIQELYNRNR